MKPLQDRRLVPARPDLAAAHLRGAVEADRYVEGERCRVSAALADVRPEPRSDCSIDTQVLAGETVMVYDRAEGYAWVQLNRDGYVGWLPEAAIGPAEPEPTHLVTALRTLVFPGPDLKLPMIAHLPQGARVTVRDVAERRGSQYALLADGTATVMRHLAPIDAPPAPDFVSVAEAYIGTPYLWGGRSSLGIDCSGLVQTALMMAGISAPRDTDMQEASTGEVVRDPDLDALRRGDLVFWSGHVAMVADPDRLLHATGHFMATVEEPLAAAIARIAAAGYPVTSVRRLAAPGR
jgi:cell wall-associated NlpC family hydrolase